MSTQGRRDLTSTRAVFGQTELEKTEACGTSVQKALKAKVTRGHRSLLLQEETTQAGQCQCFGGIRGLAEAGGPLALMSEGQSPCQRPGPSSQALAAGCGASPVVRVQGTQPQVTGLWSVPSGPHHPGVSSDLVQ